MSDTVMTITGIVIAVLIMFMIPVIAIAGQHDEIAQTTVETVVADFVSTVSEQGKITEYDYEKLVEKLNATGNVYDVQIEVQLKDDNPERKSVTSTLDSKVKGDNISYSVYSNNITNKIIEEKEYKLKKDDYVLVTAINTNVTIGSQFKNFFYKIVGKEATIVGASKGATIINSGKDNAGQISGELVNFEEEEETIVDPVTLTYVTDPLEYPLYPEYLDSRMGRLKSMHDNCLNNNCKGKLTHDISQKQVTVSRGETIQLTSEKPVITPGNPGTTVNFDRWVTSTSSYGGVKSVVMDNDKTVFAYYIFRGFVNWDKPVIYLYPDKVTEVNVKVGYIDRLTCTYPKYVTSGWNIIANPNGELIDTETNRKLYCLYYEAENNADLDAYKNGFIVKGEDAENFLEEKLAILGLNERETEEFIIYWLPKLEANKYNFIRFADSNYINENMPLEIIPKPDTTIRVLMEFKGLDEPIEIQEQQLEKVERRGFTVVEWGGSEIK